MTTYRETQTHDFHGVKLQNDEIEVKPDEGVKAYFRATNDDGHDLELVFVEFVHKGRRSYVPASAVTVLFKEKNA